MFFDVYSILYKDGFCKYSYLRSPQFFENENFAACATRARAAEFDDFFNWPPKNIPDQHKRVAFQKSLKVLNHSTLLFIHNRESKTVLWLMQPHPVLRLMHPTLSSGSCSPTISWGSCIPTFPEVRASPPVLRLMYPTLSSGSLILPCLLAHASQPVLRLMHPCLSSGSCIPACPQSHDSLPVLMVPVGKTH